MRLAPTLAALVLTVSASAEAGCRASTLPRPVLTFSDPAELQARLHTYFDGELAESWAFGSFGAAGVGLGAWLWSTGTELHRGEALPLFAVGLLQLGLAVGLRLRTPGQVRALDEGLHFALADTVRAERLRMRRVNQGFPLYAAAEVALGFAGVASTAFGLKTHQDFATGVGIALALEAAVMLFLDQLAEARGLRYESALLGFRF